ncbi:MAG: LacI family transcriptional regulator [Actinobacteria bacterium]|nr:LacI family transcriptional regulator [Actinomycetota bacterium]
MRRPRIADVAAAAGVSKTAVSFAFNDPSRLSAATLKRILEAGKELGYSPDPVARSMSTGRTQTIGLLVPQPLVEMTRNPFLAMLLEGIAEVAEAAALPILLVSPIRGSMEKAVTGAAVDGFLTLGLETFRPTMHMLERRGLPFVMIDCEPVEGVASVNIDDEQGARIAMSHVLEQGHRRIGILGIRSPQRGQWSKYVGTLQRRMAGYAQALSAVGLSLDDPGVRLTECSVSEAGGYQGFERLWRRGPRPSALVAMSDILALGALEAALSTGLSVPEDLSIVGFDDIPLAKLAQPALTTVRQPVIEKGRMAAQMLLDLLQSREEPRHVVLPTELIIRGSVAPAPGKGTR